MTWNQHTLMSLLLPGGLVLLAAVGLQRLAPQNLAAPSLSFLLYAGLFGGLTVAWRFRSSRIFFLLLAILLMQQSMGVVSGPSSQKQAALVAVQAAGMLIPLTYLFFGFMRERGFTMTTVAPAGLFLFVEWFLAMVFSKGAQIATSHSYHRANTVVSKMALLAFTVAAILLFVRFLVTRKATDSAMLWSLLALLLALVDARDTRLFSLYTAAATWILAISIVENSYMLAYQDELTSLPSRRAFNDALLRLQDPYSIAVVDIDHFKRFNDTYGHDVGDQVLKLVAVQLSRVTGGGRAYRCGGEEFTILFPDRTTSEVVDHLESLRRSIENSGFRVRGDDRRQQRRGPDRRSVEAKVKKPQLLSRKLDRRRSSQEVTVTVSIGVATSTARTADPDLVLRTADKALYRAKANGRNRIEAAPFKIRAKGTTAGIA